MKYWVIYKYPSDYPQNYVLRSYIIDGVGKQYSATPCDFSLHLSLDAARESVPKGLACIPAAQNDDHVIVETWL